MVEGHAFPEIRDGRFTVPDGRRGVEDGEDPVGGDQSLLYQGIRLGNGLGRFQDPPVKHDINDELRPSHAEVAVIVEPAAVEQDGSRDADAQHFRYRRGQFLPVADLAEDPPVPLVVPVEAVFDVVAGAESLDDARARNGLVEMAQEAAHEALRLDRTGAQAPGDAAHDEGRHRQGDQRNQRQLRRHVDEHRQKADHQQRFPEKGVETAGDAALHFSHVVGYAGKHVPLALVGEPAYGQRQDLVEKRRPQILHQPGLHPDQDPLRQVAADIGQQARSHQGDADEKQSPDDAPVADDRRKHPAEKPGHIVEAPGELGPGQRGSRRRFFKKHRQQRTEQAVVHHAEHDGKDRQQDVAGHAAANGPRIRQNAFECLPR